jgi:hypothetical protein
MLGRRKCHKHTNACDITSGKTLLTDMVFDILSIVVGYSLCCSISL